MAPAAVEARRWGAHQLLRRGRFDEAISLPKPLPQRCERMNWTSTQHTNWTERCSEFAAQQLAFRLDHVAGKLERGFCTEFCAQHAYRQKPIGSSVLFSPPPAK
jgi:hypothetical protein